MKAVEEIIQAACAKQEIPGVVLLASDKSGNFQYAKSIGFCSLKEPLSSESLPIDSVMWIASCTKLMTAISIMQCVERGLVDLDADVTRYLPELEGIQILTGVDKSSGKPILKEKTKTITTRNLITHCSGMSYDIFEPRLQAWRASQGQKPGAGNTIKDKYYCPLLFEPGTSWSYSGGTDWAGKVVERVNGNIRLGTYMEENIWKPLGIKDITFRLRSREDMRMRMSAMSLRDPAGSGKAIYTGVEMVPDSMEDDGGGGGAFADPNEYLKILQSLLRDDGKLLRSESAEVLFTPQLGKESQKALRETLKIPEWNLALGAVPTTEVSQVSWGIGGLVVPDDLPGWRRKGTLTWGGMPNLTWWIDRKAGLCGLYASQILPPGDPKSVKLSQVFERGIYEEYKKAKPRL